MAKKRAPHSIHPEEATGAGSDADAEFSRLFWAARKEHARLGKQATGNEPEHQAALSFARTQGWDWAQRLLEASRLQYVGQLEDALKVLMEIEGMVPDRCLGLLHHVKGAVYYLQDNYEGAIDACRRSLASPGFDRPGSAWSNLGAVLVNIGDLDGAINACRQAIESPDYYNKGKGWNNLGTALSRKGEWVEAIKAYKQALALDVYDSTAKVLANLAYVYRAIGDIKQAEKFFEKALAAPDSQGGDHARARVGLQQLRADMDTSALSADDRALAGSPTASEAGDKMDEIEAGILKAIEDAKETQYDKYNQKDSSERDDTLSILRGWSSAVTLLEGSERRWRGGGYFFKWRGCGVVIDPGFDFLRNFHDAGYHGREIQAVMVSHNHPDHNSDLKSIDDLRYELYKRRDSGKRKKGQAAALSPYALLWDLDTCKATAFGIEKPKHQYEPLILQPSYLDSKRLTRAPFKFPIRVIPFDVEHGDDVPHALGMVIELVGKNGETALRIGYTADTGYFPELPGHLKDCDVLIAHISQPSVEELKGYDVTQVKDKQDVHLRYRGTARLLKECKPKLALIGEFWAGFTDLRIPLVKGLRKLSGVNHILPTGLGLHLRLPSLDIECTECKVPTPYDKLKTAPPADAFGGLSYLCPKCFLE